MTKARHRSAGWSRGALVGAAAMVLVVAQAVAEEPGKSAPKPGEAYKSSPYHRVPNAATGQFIPCTCLFRGRSFRVGERVCMTTHKGTVITVCDLELNNSTWIPTEETCEVS